MSGRKVKPENGEGRTVRHLQPTTIYQRSVPDCLVSDEIPLPEGYVPPGWCNELIAEWKCEEALIAAGTYPTQSVLIFGPTGVGKTTSARWVAQYLDRPVFTMLLSTAIGSHLGETGKNLQLALDYAAETECLLVLDELDAVAGRRDDGRDDVSEMRRVTNTFIQLLDRWHGVRRSSMLVATTNLVNEIDSAVRRRFEVEVEAPRPTSAELSKMAGVSLPKSFTATHAEMRRLILFAKRQSVLRRVDYGDVLLSLVV